MLFIEVSQLFLLMAVNEIVTGVSAEARAADSEIQALRQQLLYKDAEMKRRLAAKDKEIHSLKAGTKDPETVYHILEPTLSFFRQGYATTCELPILGRFLKLGSSIVDVGVQRITPFGTVSHLDSHLKVLMPYLDANVISPQVNTWRAMAIALLGPTLESTSQSIDPYLATARIYREHFREAVQPMIARLEPYVLRAMVIVRPLPMRAWSVVRPLAEKLEEKADQAVVTLDACTQSALKNISPEVVFERSRHAAGKIVDFSRAHAGDVKYVVHLSVGLVADMAKAASGNTASAPSSGTSIDH